MCVGCRRGWNKFQIDWNANVNECCYHFAGLGPIFEMNTSSGGCCPSNGVIKLDCAHFLNIIVIGVYFRSAFKASIAHIALIDDKTEPIHVS